MSQPQDMILFTIGPVQSFITAARRTQDLAVGSRLLSWLSQKGLEFASRQGATIVYPRLNTAAGANLPNRLVLLAPEGRGVNLADDLQCEIQRLWTEDLGGKIKAELIPIVQLWDVAAAGQMEQALEIYWAVKPWDGQDSTYLPAYREASLGLNARKSLRAYPSSPQPGVKCTLCGIRSALNKTDPKTDWETLSVHYGSRILRENERLCAVCAAKRLGYEAGFKPLDGVVHFPSTSDIAVASFRTAIEKNWAALQQPAIAFLGALQDSQIIARSQNLDQGTFRNLDGDLFFKDFYRAGERVAEISTVTLSKDAQDKIVGCLQNLIDSLVEKKLDPPPNPYYAILVIDGDKMGELFDDPDGVYTGSPVTQKEQHKKISAALNRVAGRMAKDAGQKFQATVIYSGGDDALFFLPVDTLLSAANDLRKVFVEELIAEGFPGRHASAGAAIVHHQAPLGRSLAAARSAGAEAKDLYDRDALAVWLLRRSGEPRRARLHWDQDLIAGLGEYRQLVAQGSISGALAYEFQDEAVVLPDRAIELELKRLLERHRSSALLPTGAASLADRLLAGMNGIIHLPSVSRAAQLAEWLVIMRFLAKGE